MIAFSRQSRPSWKGGFARHACRSAYPELWRGLVGAWMPSLGPTGLTLRDISGRGNHGTFVGGVPPWTVSAYGQAVDLQATYYATLPTPLPCSNVTWTVVSLCHPINGYGPILAKGYQKAGVFLRAGIYYMISYDDSYAGLTGAAPPAAWGSYAFTYNAGNVAAYRDGKQVATGTGFGTTSTWVDTKFGLGNWGAFNGEIATVSLHSRILTPNEIQLLSDEPDALVMQRQRVFASAVAADSFTGPTTYHLGADVTPRTVYKLQPA